MNSLAVFGFTTPEFFAKGTGHTPNAGHILSIIVMFERVGRFRTSANTFINNGFLQQLVQNHISDVRNSIRAPIAKSILVSAGFVPMAIILTIRPGAMMNCGLNFNKEDLDSPDPNLHAS